MQTQNDFQEVENHIASVTFVTGIIQQTYTAAVRAFSAMGAIDGKNKIQTGNSMILSEQQLVGCSDYGTKCEPREA